ncbi:MAG: glycine zipper 2TM domain-containing protein [Sphingobium sp.]|nr:glycine zipper 2TM domain-containing protein [Sphingobium sp.]
MTARTFKKLSIALALAATTAGAVAPAQAHDRGNHYGWYKHDRDDRYDRYDRYRGYEDRRYYEQPVYQGYQGGYRYEGCRRSDGATGTILGAIAGGLIGNSVAGRHGDRTTGTIIGGAVGAVAGRAIDKNGNNCR